jgi:hypothetical protein
MRCHNCGRETYWPERVGNQRIKPADVPEGVLTAMLQDGTCVSCYRLLRGMTRHKRRPSETRTYHRRNMSDAELLRATRSVLRYFQSRQHRGVPRDGLDPATLVKPGLFLMEVR